MAAFHRENAYVAAPLDPANIPEHKLAENQRPTKQSQAVYAAATTGDVDGVKSALAAGGNPNWYKNPEEGATALHKAASGGHTGCIEVLLQKGAVVDERLLTNHSSPLHLACANGHLEAARVLIDASAPINKGNSYGNAPINGALISGHRGIVGLLLEKGADVKWTNNKNSTLLHFLAYSPMAAGDKKAVAQQLIDAGVDIDAKDDEGMTALHVVGRSGDKEMATFLFESGADHTLKDAKDKTPLQWAQLNNHTAVGLLLNAKKAGGKAGVAAATSP